MSTKRKPPVTLARPVVKQSAKIPTKTAIDETRTLVSTQSPLPSKADTIELSSDSSSSYESDDDDASNDGDGDKTAAKDSHAHTSVSGPTTPPPEADPHRDPAAGDTEMLDEDDEATSPTFGDLLRGVSANQTIAVPSALQLQSSTPLSLPNQSQHHHLLATTSAAGGTTSISSLGTVLSQALRSDDAELLESCLSTTDLATVRATVQRLDGALAADLLSRLAARMRRRPGRAHGLMAWVQWTLVAHGGALAARPDLIKQLAELGKVLDERARGLPALLALKGRLDMLDAQMQLRRESRAAARAGSGRAGAGGSWDDEDKGEGEGNDDDEEDEEGIVYVEGEEDDGALVGGDVEEGGVGEDGGVPITNGIADESSEEDQDESEDESEDSDDGAVEALDEDEVDFDDEESDEDDDESEDEIVPPPAKSRKVAASTGPKRR